MEYLKIGQMAKLNHISEQTLRLYDRMGLLKPQVVDPDSSYRYYDIRQSAKLDMIQHMKTLGMSLKEITDLFNSRDTSSITGRLEEKNKQIDLEMRELKNQKRAVERMVESIERYQNSPPDASIVLEYINKRYIYCIDSGINFYNYDIRVYEGILRKLKGSLRQDMLPETFFLNAGTILRQDHLLQRQFVSTEVFVFVDKEFAESDLVRQIHSGTYLCIYCDCFEKEIEYANRLLDEIQQKDYTVCGDFICEVIFEPPVSSAQSRGMFMRLQVPIRLC